MVINKTSVYSTDLLIQEYSKLYNKKIDLFCTRKCPILLKEKQINIRMNKYDIRINSTSQTGLIELLLLVIEVLQNNTTEQQGSVWMLPYCSSLHVWHNMPLHRMLSPDFDQCYPPSTYIHYGHLDKHEQGRMDDLSFFEYLSPFFFLIEFHCTFSISYKILPYYIY